MAMMVEYLLRRSGSVDGVLQMVDSAITFAAKQHPRDFLKIRSQIKKKLNNALLFVGSDCSSNSHNAMTDTTDGLDINMADAATTCESCNVADKNNEVRSDGSSNSYNSMTYINMADTATTCESCIVGDKNNGVSSFGMQQDKNAAVESNGDDEKKRPLVIRFKMSAAMKKEQLVSGNNKVSSLAIQQGKNAAVEPNGDDKKKGPLVIRFKLPPAKKPSRR